MGNCAFRQCSFWPTYDEKQAKPVWFKICISEMRSRRVEETTEVIMGWLAIDMSITLGGLVLLSLARWLFDRTQRRHADH